MDNPLRPPNDSTGSSTAPPPARNALDGVNARFAHGPGAVGSISGSRIDEKLDDVEDRYFEEEDEVEDSEDVSADGFRSVY